MNPSLLFRLTKHEVKFPDSFIKKIESSVPVSDAFTKFLDNCESDGKEIRSRSCRDGNEHTPKNCAHNFLSTTSFRFHFL